MKYILYRCQNEIKGTNPISVLLSHILDTILYSDEGENIPSLLFKTDFLKSHDTINHKCLLSVI